MTETTWLDPARPGVPLNPERNGWHWVKIIHLISQPRPRLWRSKIDRWELSDGALISPSEFAERWRYLGPVLLPNEAAALQKRVAELEGQNDMLRHANDKLRAMLTELNARHEPLQRAFITAVELLNDAAPKGGKDE